MLTLPILAAKALELFMISIATKAADEARSRSSKRVTPTHLKHALQKNEAFDFLNEIIEKVPDGTGDKEEGGRKKGGGRKKKSDD